ncbi:MAG: hypothetical protein IKG03_05805, partial [Clostridiales bacterium]|nr:hypothetical protein [Clostridiales bacterium]
MKTARIKLTFLEPVLGSSPNDEDIYTRFIGDKAPDAPSLKEEIESLGEDGADIVAERGTTVFPRDVDGTPIFWSYQIEGFFKGTCGFLRTVPGTLSSKLKAYKKQIDGRIFVEGDESPTNKTGRKVRINDAFPIDLYQRPLRAQTPQGERVSLACSERIPEGANCEFNITCLI